LLASAKEEIFPNATDFQAVVHPGVGHAINFSYNATGAYGIMLEYLKRHELLNDRNSTRGPERRCLTDESAMLHTIVVNKCRVRNGYLLLDVSIDSRRLFTLVHLNLVPPQTTGS
jgi:hypothetical protein